MGIATKPLRDEHKELLPHVEMLRKVADSTGEIPVEKLRQEVNEVYTFLTTHLIPHAYAEDHALYPVVGKIMGAPQATDTMHRDHVEISKLTQELGYIRAKLGEDTAGAKEDQALRRILYGLYALLKVHFAKEEEIYLPLLDAHMTPDEAKDLFHNMEEAASKAMAHATA